MGGVDPRGGSRRWLPLREARAPGRWHPSARTGRSSPSQRQSLMRLTGSMTNPIPTADVTADVIVVGAGFAGLSAARDLVRRGYDVVVLEGRDRVGGRSLTTTIAGTPVDLGATFVGPTQDEVVALAAELGCDTVPTHSRGKNLIHWRGRVRSYRG